MVAWHYQGWYVLELLAATRAWDEGRAQQCRQGRHKFVHADAFSIASSKVGLPKVQEAGLAVVMALWRI